MAQQVLILNKTQVQNKINRIAHQILEDNFEEQEIILAGVVARGYRLALRLEAVLKEICDIKITLVEINLNKESSKLESSINVPIESCQNKVIVLVDDVLNSGKTLAYGLGVFLNTPHKKIRTVVLVDRSHKIFPIATDFVGLQLATILKEHVDVVMDVEGEEDRVYLS